MLASCGSKKKESGQPLVQYTCSMHPQVLKDAPGECPICHMDLIPLQPIHIDSTMKMMETDSDSSSLMDLDSSSNDMGHNDPGMVNELTLTDLQIRTANILVDTIGKVNFKSSNVLTGTVTFNENNIEIVSARVKGRVEHLYYKNMGDFVAKGARLFDLYSEELNSAKQEYILLLQQRSTQNSGVINFNHLVDAARHKLLLWGMTSGQVRALSVNSKPSFITTFYSKASGYINQLNIIEGAYVIEGQSIMRLANTSSVWVETQAYASQLAGMNNAKKVMVQIPALGNRKIEGEIEFASPEINIQTRVNLLRVKISNAGNELKPGMSANVYVNNNSSQVIALPAEAIIRTTGQPYVWVKTGNNSFKMKQIVIGGESGNKVEIKQGISSLDVVVVSGAYLLNSEYLLRNGVNSMAGMNM